MGLMWESMKESMMEQQRGYKLEGELVIDIHALMIDSNKMLLKMISNTIQKDKIDQVDYH